MAQMPQLKDIRVHNPADRDLEAISKLSSVKRLATISDFCAGPYGNDGMKAICGMRNLEFLRLGRNTVSDDGLAMLGNLVSLRELDMESDRGISAKGLAGIKELQNLRVLRCDSLSVANLRSMVEILRGTAGRSDLQDLRLIGKLTDVQLNQLSELKKLSLLEFRWNAGLTDGALAALIRALPNLRVVRVAFKATE